MGSLISEEFQILLRFLVLLKSFLVTIDMVKVLVPLIW